MEEITFKINTEYIHLIQLLKASGALGTGGIAKLVVEDGLVKYNGEVDYRKRLKVKPGDVVEFDNYKINVQ